MGKLYGVLIAVAALGIGGCQPKITVNGIEVYKSIWRDAESSVRYRAASDLDCSPYKLDVSLVRRQGKYPVEVYVEGCGTRAMYTRALRRHHGKFTDKNTVWERAS